MTLVDDLSAAVAGEVRADEPLGPWTTLKVGGPATALVRAETAEDLAAVARVGEEHGVPWLVLGRGSNVLVPDVGWPGIAVVLGRGFRGVDVAGEVAVAGAAEPMPVLAVALERRGLGGLEFGVAIPGTVGGAVRMNAGAHGREVRDVLLDVDVARLADGGRLERLAVEDLRMAYRRSALPSDAVVVRARFELRAAERSELAAAMAEMRAWRRGAQPINEPSCGSVFTNPPGDSAGRLIEAAGVKGHRIGGAEVSRKHANFITTRRGATAADVLDLIRLVQRTVHEREGVTLHPEVVVVGEREVGV